MTLEPLPGFKSLTTHHCVTGSMRHVYAYHDHPISEEMLLGLGAGVGFVYWHQKGTMPFYGGRANTGRQNEEGLEITAGKRTGVRVKRFHTTSARKAEKALIEMLEASEPVVVVVDMGFLPYFNLPEDFHFGAHVIAVGGYDAESRQVLVADRDDALHPVSLETLAQARGSKFKPFPPRNTWFTFDFSQKRPPQPEEVWQAVGEVATSMLEPPITNLGVKGIRKAVKRTLKWPEIMSEEELRYACFNVYIFIDAEGGTGGGIFRLMYGRFLNEAAGITGEKRLTDLGEEMRAIGEMWQGVAQIFNRACTDPKPAELLPEATTFMEAIADYEEAAWERLRALTDEYR